MEDQNSPYFLHPSDNPGLILVSQPLVGENYNSWRRAMRMALSAKNKLGFVDGTISAPPADNPLAFHAWERNNNIVASWLLNSVSKEICASVIYSSTATAIWSDLQERFGQQNGPRIFQLKKELLACVQGSSTVNQYFTKLKTLWEELCEYKPTHTCSCGGVQPLLAHSQNEYVLMFLMGLNEQFAQIRGQILLMDPLPSINKVFSLVIQDEKQREIGAQSASDTDMACAIPPANSKNKNSKKDKPMCAHCGYLGHTKDKCFKLHGYPPGHKKHKQSSMVNQVTDSNTLESGTTFSPQQCHQLLALLQAQLSRVSIPSQDQGDSSNSVGSQAIEDDWQG